MKQKALAGLCVSATTARARLIIVSEIFYPETTSTGYYLTELATGLSGAVEVLCARPAGHKGLAKSEVYKNCRISRIGRMTASGEALWKRVFGSFACAIRFSFALMCKVRPGDTVLVVTNPPVLPPLVALVSRLRRSRFILLVHDLYPEAAITAGVIRSGGTAETVLRAVQTATYRSADVIICIGRDMRVRLEAAVGLKPGKIEVIPNWAELPPAGACRAKSQSDFARTHACMSHFTVLHAGNLGRTHDANVITDAAELLRDIMDIQFLVATLGRFPSGFREVVSDRKLSNVKLITLAPERDRQWDTLTAADVVLIAFKAKMAGVSVPSRLYNAMAAGRPIIAVADAESELAQVIVENRIGWVVPPGNAKLLRDAILSARGSRRLLVEFGERARRAAESTYSIRRALTSYSRVIGVPQSEA